MSEFETMFVPGYDDEDLRTFSYWLRGRGRVKWKVGVDGTLTSLICDMSPPIVCIKDRWVRVVAR